MADLLDMLTAREVQDLLQVDRSTIYRMAEDGRLPAVKVGKQWRFPPEEINKRFQIEITAPAAQNGHSKDLVMNDSGRSDLANLSSWNRTSRIAIICPLSRI